MPVSEGAARLIRDRRRSGISIPSPCNAFKCQKCCKCPRAPLNAFWKYWVSSKWIEMWLGTFKCRKGDQSVGWRSKCDRIFSGIIASIWFLNLLHYVPRLRQEVRGKTSLIDRIRNDTGSSCTTSIMYEHVRPISLQL